jgi:hypothetical protein
MQVNELGEEEAANRGFRQWTTEPRLLLKSRVHLLAVTDPRLVQCSHDEQSNFKQQQ